MEKTFQRPKVTNCDDRRTVLMNSLAHQLMV